MNSPAISIVLPTYNGSRYIRTSIESCLKQSFADFELIIVNDCSTDNTPQIIEEYARLDQRVKIVHNPVNKKLPLSLNAGFDLARGRYHSWTSDDNYYAENALAELLASLTSHPGVDYVYTDYTLIDEVDRVIGKRTFGDINRRFTSFQGSSACFLYKEEVYKRNNGYDPAAFLTEDYDFFVRTFLSCRVKYEPRHDLYYYRDHGSSLTGTQRHAVNDIAKIMLERQMRKLETKLPPDQLALLYRKFAVYHAVLKNNATAYRGYLRKLWKLSKTEALKTIFYVPLVKGWKAISIGAAGLAEPLRLLFGKR
ncbi:MAG TPA: glycosyltransferase family A protein [Chitinophagaceae bacterium]|nr:glycosyltransferase family A protein [Chitinophagaceae bacterium]